jgi:uncharacterized protein YceH (UPF0502 family)
MSGYSAYFIARLEPIPTFANFRISSTSGLFGFSRKLQYARIGNLDMFANSEKETMLGELENAQFTKPRENNSWPVLNPIERRIVGVLIEKGKTTPDNYPLTLNALINGANQKNNREPVLDLTDAEVLEALPNLKRLGLVQQILGSGRTDKFRHVAYDSWKVDKVQLAVLAELLLRGPQSEGDLRGRASRMEPVADLEALRLILKTLAERGLVVHLTPEGKRGTMITHGFHLPEELQQLRHRAERIAWEEPSPQKNSISGKGDVIESRLTALEQTLADLKNQFEEVKKQLGL